MKPISAPFIPIPPFTPVHRCIIKDRFQRTLNPLFFALQFFTYIYVRCGAVLKMNNVYLM